ELPNNEISNNILNDIQVLLSEYVTTILASNYNYIIFELNQLPDFIIAEGFIIYQFE
ncbi:11652_t:CDS:1, partial [Dentiscutata heterogama]